MTKKKPVIDIVDYVSAYKAFIETLFSRDFEIGQKNVDALMFLQSLCDVSALEAFDIKHAK